MVDTKDNAPVSLTTGAFFIVSRYCMNGKKEYNSKADTIAKKPAFLRTPLLCLLWRKEVNECVLFL